MGDFDSAPLEDYIHKVYDHQVKYPSQNPANQLFPLGPSAPQLFKANVNRLLLYYGCFNPPHGGHLRLLRHVFYHGTYGLNVCAAIVRPLNNVASERKLQQEGNGFIFDRDERCMLWKRDLCFPHWAWVHEGGNGTFTSFLRRLQQVAHEDGFKIEYVRLTGPNSHDYRSPPGLDWFECGSENLIISDAARAADYQRSSGRIKDFSTFSKWKQLPFHEEDWRKTIKSQRQTQDDELLEVLPARTEADIARKQHCRKLSIEADVELVREDMKNILYCSRKLSCDDRTLTIRFVKTKESKSKESKEGAISSTILRNAMSNFPDPKLERYIYSMALSADILWGLRSRWRERARARQNELITFDPFEIDVADERMEIQYRGRADGRWLKETQNARLAVARQSMNTEGDGRSEQDEEEESEDEKGQEEHEEQEKHAEDNEEEEKQSFLSGDKMPLSEGNLSRLMERLSQLEKKQSQSQEELLYPRGNLSPLPQRVPTSLEGQILSNLEQDEQDRGLKRKRSARREVSGPAAKRLEAGDEGAQSESKGPGEIADTALQSLEVAANGSAEDISPRNKMRILTEMLVELQKTEESKYRSEAITRLQGGQIGDLSKGEDNQGGIQQIEEEQPLSRVEAQHDESGNK
ncbi:MAG: hypothetical protein Q9222_002435 [Ikaeria aurantiellina]